MEKRQALSEKQEKFCRLCAEGKTTAEAEWLVGFSAGYGRRLRKKEHIRKTIAEKEAAIDRRMERTMERTPTGDADSGQTKERKSRPSAQRAEILSFLTEVMRDSEEADLKTRMKAAELLGKRESLFEKKEQPQKNRIIIVDDLP